MDKQPKINRLALSCGSNQIKLSGCCGGVRWPDVPRILWEELISQSRPCATDVCGEFIKHHEATSHLTALIMGSEKCYPKSYGSQHKVIPGLDVCEKIMFYLFSVVQEYQEKDKVVIALNIFKIRNIQNNLA